MSELEDKLSAILGNPQAMSQIMSLAQSLGGGSASGSSEPEPSPPSAAEPAVTPPASTGTPPASMPDLSALLGSLMGNSSGNSSGSSSGGLDPRLFALVSKVMSEYQSNDDGRAALLQALRPFVKEKRYAKLDKAIQIAKLSRMIRIALDVFKGGGNDHV